MTHALALLLLVFPGSSPSEWSRVYTHGAQIYGTLCQRDWEARDQETVQCTDYRLALQGPLVCAIYAREDARFSWVLLQTYREPRCRAD